MRSRQVLATALLLGILSVGIAVPALGVEVEPADPATATPADGNDSVGVQMSAFMQSTAADANASVETGMWQVAVNRSAAPEATVRQRVQALDRRLATLRNRSADLATQRANATLPPAVYAARASAVRAQLDNLRTAVNGTAETARHHGVNAPGLDRVRTDAANASGPNVPAAARPITDPNRGPPAGAPGGQAAGGRPAGGPAEAGTQAGQTGNSGREVEPGDRPAGRNGTAPGDGPGPTNATTAGAGRPLAPGQANVSMNATDRPGEANGTRAAAATNRTRGLSPDDDRRQSLRTVTFAP